MGGATRNAADDMDDDGQQAEHEPGMGIRVIFGCQLKRLREWAGLERPEFGARTGYAPSAIATCEQGRRIPPPEFIDTADSVLGAHGVLLELKEEVARARYPVFFRGAARLEAKAVEMHVYAAHGMLGLLQTEEYARAVFAM